MAEDSKLPPDQGGRRTGLPSPWNAPKLPSFMPDSSMVADVVPSANYGDRRDGKTANLVILHYTGMPDAEGALTRLCTPGSEVSAHYVVLTDGRVIQCVQERNRAWHAGVSSWKGETDVNSASIGIEIVNPGHDWGYPDFPRRQIAAVIALCKGIIIRKEIKPHNILGHSDIAPDRKKDPGEKFPWALLAQSGVGIWVEPAPISGEATIALGARGPEVETAQEKLKNFGYGLAVNGNYDSATMEVVAAFQRHFRPAKIDGLMDASTMTTLDALLAKVPA